MAPMDRIDVAMTAVGAVSVLAIAAIGLAGLIGGWVPRGRKGADPRKHGVAALLVGGAVTVEWAAIHDVGPSGALFVATFILGAAGFGMMYVATRHAGETSWRRGRAEGEGRDGAL